jgi:DNA polymerase III alpha subunit
MLRDKFGQLVFSETELCDYYLANPEIKIGNILVNDTITLDPVLGLQSSTNFVKYESSNLTVEEFDKHNQKEWLMPESYKELDIAQYVLDQCKSEAELQRAGQELLLYQDNDMFDLLKYLKYLVDTMRQNNIVWGVGRGSSVSSFVLYLIGVHKINSLYYDLPVEEFFKLGDRNAQII